MRCPSAVTKKKAESAMISQPSRKIIAWRATTSSAMPATSIPQKNRRRRPLTGWRQCGQ